MNCADVFGGIAGNGGGGVRDSLALWKRSGLVPGCDFARVLPAPVGVVLNEPGERCDAAGAYPWP